MIRDKQKNRFTCCNRQIGYGDGNICIAKVPAPIIAQNEAFDQSFFLGRY